MTDREAWAKRVAYLQAELEVVARMAALLDDEGDTVVVPEVPVGSAAPPTPPPRFSYVDGTWYQLVGPNPFRRGGIHRAVFDFLATRWGDQSFDRARVVDALGALSRERRIDSVRGTDDLVLDFLRKAGTQRRVLVMVDRPEVEPVPRATVATALPPASEAVPAPAAAPAATAAAAPASPSAPPSSAAPTTAASPSKPKPKTRTRRSSTVRWVLVGTPDLSDTPSYAPVWDRLQGAPFTRPELELLVTELMADGTIGVSNDPVAFARAFMGLVVDQGGAEKVSS